MDQHPHGDAGHVESVEEVLDGHVGLIVHGVRLLKLQHTLGHRLHNVGVAGLYGLEGLTEVGQINPIGLTARLKLHKVPETLSIPILKQFS